MTEKIKKIYHRVKTIGLFLVVIVVMCASCKTTKKAGRVKGCDCPRWSMEEPEVIENGQGKV